MLTRWPAFTRFLDDGRICLSNNAAERALRGIALGRRAWLFAGSDRGGERAAVIYTLIATAKLNDINPQAWLADVLRRIADHPASRLHELLPWHWKTLTTRPLPPDAQPAAVLGGWLPLTLRRCGANQGIIPWVRLCRTQGKRSRRDGYRPVQDRGDPPAWFPARPQYW